MSVNVKEKEEEFISNKDFWQIHADSGLCKILFAIRDDYQTQFSMPFAWRAFLKEKPSQRFSPAQQWFRTRKSYQHARIFF